jgi:hypothetical protein
MSPYQYEKQLARKCLFTFLLNLKTLKKIIWKKKVNKTAESSGGGGVFKNWGTSHLVYCFDILTFFWRPRMRRGQKWPKTSVMILAANLTFLWPHDYGKSFLMGKCDHHEYSPAENNKNDVCFGVVFGSARRIFHA